MGRRIHFTHKAFQHMCVIRNYPQFPGVMPDPRAGYPRVTEQYAMFTKNI
ncbi:hypothetical protein FXW07_04965 [Methanosarcina sp. DH1]|nr:hypothetical protein [Methanosarcina sp. DH1]